jgi:hypothetical protein
MGVRDAPPVRLDAIGSGCEAPLPHHRIAGRGMGSPACTRSAPVLPLGVEQVLAPFDPVFTEGKLPLPVTAIP